MEHDSYSTRIDSADCTTYTGKRSRRQPSALRHALRGAASTPVALDLKVTDPNGFSSLAIARCFDATQAVTWLREHGADQPDQGYAACRKGLAERQKSASAAR
ncbi:hypothetical protein [Paraburkholderia bannensis]|uniref:hypothetical protein n=1 Tax=Paraburkholderia bannensis TaxID=765414 RepID=UPI000481660D|nr:hypothetical protein [Paraburkholderia bannensis]